MLDDIVAVLGGLKEELVFWTTTTANPAFRPWYIGAMTGLGPILLFFAVYFAYRRWRHKPAKEKSE